MICFNSLSLSAGFRSNQSGLQLSRKPALRLGLLILFFINSLQSKLPDHSILRRVKNIFSLRHFPETHELPAPDGEFIKKRNCRAGFGRLKHRPVKRIEPLVAAPARARVKNRVRRVAVSVRITRIDFAEIGQKRNQFSAALVNSVADAVNFRNLVPRKNFADFRFLQKRHVHIF